MPGQTGFAVCRAAKDRPETRLTPIVLITGLGRVEDRIQGIEAGADDFLIKPVRKEELLARVKSLVRIKRFTDELGSAETVVFTLAALSSERSFAILHDEVRRGWWDGTLVDELEKLLKDSPEGWAGKPVVPTLGFRMVLRAAEMIAEFPENLRKR